MGRNRKLTLVLLWASVFLPAAQVAAADQQPRSLAAILQGLRAIPVDEETSYGYIPEDGRRLLVNLKEEVGRTIINTVTSIHTRPAASEIQARIIEELGSRDVVIGPPPDVQKYLSYGYVPELEVTPSPGDGNLVGIRVTFSLACGNDDADLYLFRFGKGGWSKVLVQASSDYGDISAGQGDFEYRMSSPSRGGAVLILTAFVQPACTSVWHPIRYSIYTVLPSLPEAERLSSAVTDAVAIDEGYEATAVPGGFTITYSVDDAGFRIRETLHLNVIGREVKESRTRPGG